MAMAILPDEFPVVLTIFLALGAATMLCVDKTGTLTQNQMTLRALFVEGGTFDLVAEQGEFAERFHALLENAVLASKRDPFDPMERALHEAGERLIKNTEHLHPDWSLAREYPLVPGLLAVSHAWAAGGEQIIIASKGAPEAVAELCHLSVEQREGLSREVTMLATQGLRVLAVARGATVQSALPTEHRDAVLRELATVVVAGAHRLSSVDYRPSVHAHLRGRATSG